MSPYGGRFAGGGPVRILPAACRIRSEPFVAGVRGGRAPAAGTRSDQMTPYLISFDEGAMDHIPEQEMPDVAKAVAEMRDEAREAGVFVFSGGLDYDVESVVVATDGMVSDGPYPESKELIGGLMVVDVPTQEAAVEWATKVAVGCRCPQEVRVFRSAPPSGREKSR
jgi:hypothetical protein